MRVSAPLMLWVLFLATGTTILAFGRFWLQRLISVVALFASLLLAVALLFQVKDGAILVSRIGGWPPGVGITLVVDLLSALVLVITLAVLLAVLIFAIVEPGTDDEAFAFHPSYLAMAAGIALATTTGDLFNFFVAFEIILLASFFLLTFSASARGIRAGITYVVINLLISALFLIAIAVTYFTTGTVSLAQLAEAVSSLPIPMQEVLWSFLFFVLGVKAAIFPVFMWLPDSYPVARGPVTAVFAALLTKVGVYGIIRIKSLVFPEVGMGKIILALAMLTMVVGVLGAIAQADIKRILSFDVVSQVGYMIFGIGLATVGGLAGAIFFMVQQVPVKASLFLVGGVVEQQSGTTSLKKVGGLAKTRPWLAALFVLAALSLAGFPPFSGFAAKLSLIRAGLDGREFLATGVAAAVSILTLYTMIKIWGGAFWGSPETPVTSPLSAKRERGIAQLTWVTAGLVGVTLFVAVASGFIYDLSLRAAEQLLDPAIYVRAVLK